MPRPRTISSVHQSQLRSWVKALVVDDPQDVFPGEGQMKPDSWRSRSSSAR